jgi:hypothetical protein
MRILFVFCCASLFSIFYFSFFFSLHLSHSLHRHTHSPPLNEPLLPFSASIVFLTSLGVHFEWSWVLQGRDCSFQSKSLPFAGIPGHHKHSSFLDPCCYAGESLLVRHKIWIRYEDEAQSPMLPTPQLLKEAHCVVYQPQRGWIRPWRPKR